MSYCYWYQLLKFLFIRIFDFIIHYSDASKFVETYPTYAHLLHKEHNFYTQCPSCDLTNNMIELND